MRVNTTFVCLGGADRPAIIDVGCTRSQRCGKMHPTLNAETDARPSLIPVDPILGCVIYYCTGYSSNPTWPGRWWRSLFRCVITSTLSMVRGKKEKLFYMKLCTMSILYVGAPRACQRKKNTVRQSLTGDRPFCGQGHQYVIVLWGRHLGCQWMRAINGPASSSCVNGGKFLFSRLVASFRGTPHGSCSTTRPDVQYYNTTSDETSDCRGVKKPVTQEMIPVSRTMRVFTSTLPHSLLQLSHHVLRG